MKKFGFYYLFASIALFGTFVHADEDDTPEADEEAGKKYGSGKYAKQRLLDCNLVKRETEFKQDKEKITLEVETDDDAKKFKRNGDYKCDSDLKVEMKTTKADSLKVSVDLRQQNGDAKARITYRMKMYQIIEFEETNGDGYDANDTVIQTFTLGTGYDNGAAEEWKQLEKYRNETDGQASTGACKSFDMATTANTFVAVGHYCDEAGVSFFKDSGKEWVDKYNITRNVTLNYKLNPNVIKFDYLINNFQYKSNKSKLAITAKLKTKTKFKIRKLGTVVNRKGFSELDLQSGVGGFSWKDTINADGADVEVIMSKLKVEAVGDDSDHTYAFTFNKTGPVKNFIWDPEFANDFGGVDSPNGVGALAPSLFSLAAVFALLLNN